MTSEEKTPAGDDAVATHLHGDKWAAALERLGAEDRKRFDVTSMLNRNPQDILADVLAATNEKKDDCMRKRWKIVIKGRTIILRDVLEKITCWINKFGVIGTAIAGYDPVTTALPWAAVRFILQAGVNDVEIFGFVLQSIESISNLIASTAIFEVLYLNHSHHKFAVSDKLSENIVTLYAAILQHLSELLHYYSQRTATRLLKSVGISKTDFEGKYEPVEAARKEVWELARLAEAEKASWILENLDRIEITQQEQQQALSRLLESLQQPINRINTQLNAIQDGLERDNRIQILRSISTVPYATHHKAARKGRLEGSGQWLLKNKAFQAWRSESSSSVLWLHGIPGSGKTKLTSLVVDELTGCESMAYFYCMRNPAEPLRGQCDAILASLVRQLASSSADSSILSPVVAQYQDALDGMAGFDDFAWTSDESSSILLELLQEYPAVTLVFDALDEVNLEDRQELMDILSELLRESPNLLKIFVSSRENYDIALHFEGSPNIYIDAQDNKGDIESFIDDRLTAAKLLRGRLTDTLRTKVANTLLQKAHGMFRWVDLQIQSLRPLKVAADIEARLGVLPATLEESYWGIYQDILSSGEHATDLAVFTFQWVMYAKGSIQSQYFASFASCALSSEEMKQTFTETEIKDVCANLVVTRSGVLEFAHLSVREFLEGLPKRSVDTVLPEQSHGRIAAACLRYMGGKIAALSESSVRLMGDDPKVVILVEAESSEATEKEPQEMKEPTPTDVMAEEPEEKETPAFKDAEKAMIEYAARYWPEHASESGNRRKTKPLQGLIRGFLVNDTTKTVTVDFRVWCWTMRNNTTFPLNQWKSGHSQLTDAAQSPANPIWLACLHGWLDVIEYLYDVNYEGLEEARCLSSYMGRSVSSGESSDEKRLSPLWYAVATGNFALAECILNRSPDPLQTKAQATSQPLVRASEDGDEKLVTLLLNKEHGGIEVEADALVGAAENGKRETCRIILDNNPELIHQSGSLALFTSCKRGHLDTVVFLLDRGVSTERAVDGLHFAALHGYAEVIRELLGRGVGKGGMAKSLIAAISNGDQKSIGVLVEFGAEKEPAAVLRATRDDTPRTALRLIGHGFQVRGRSARTGRAPLHYASIHGRDKVVAAILGAGAVVDVYDNQGQTPLHLAAMYGNKECARVLLDHGADVLAQDDQGKIPLDLAEDGNKTGCETVIRSRMAELLESLLRLRDGRVVEHVPSTTEKPIPQDDVVLSGREAEQGNGVDVDIGNPLLEGHINTSP